MLLGYTLPLNTAVGFGSGSEARQPLGLAVVGGLILSQALTLYITPVIYIHLDHLGDRMARWKFINRGAKKRRPGSSGAVPRPAPAE